MTKKEIRFEMKRRFSLFADEEREALRIWEKIEALPEFISSSTILAYMSIKGEVPTKEFIDKWKGSKRFVIPLVQGEVLTLHEYDPLNLVSGYKGILEPSKDAKSISAEEIDLAFIPGVAFSVLEGKLWRLGRGKGFYDRLLRELSCPTVGLYYSFRLLPSIPIDPWDMPLDIWI